MEDINTIVEEFAFAYAISNFRNQIDFDTEGPIYKKNDGGNYGINSFENDSNPVL